MNSTIIMSVLHVISVGIMCAIYFSVYFEKLSHNIIQSWCLFIFIIEPTCGERDIVVTTLLQSI